MNLNEQREILRKNDLEMMKKIDKIIEKPNQTSSRSKTSDCKDSLHETRTYRNTRIQSN